MILVGVSGGVAAYKSCELVRLLVKAGREVQVVMTPAAERFVGPTTFAALSRRPVLTEQSAEVFPHLEASRDAMLYCIAPAGANTIARLAHGEAPNVLTQSALAFTGPLLVAPAMNPRMWAAPVTQENVRALLARGVETIGPESGEMAEGEQGAGRMSEPDEIAGRIQARLATLGSLAGRRCAGHRRRDPRAARRGALPGKPQQRSDGRSRGRRGGQARGRCDADPGCGHRIAERADAHAASGDGRAAASGHAGAVRSGADVIVMAAAVADYRPAQPVDGKRIKDSGAWTIELEATADILAELGARRREGQVLIGFAAEYGEGAVDRARAKLERKGGDVIVMNDISRTDIGFDSSLNEIVLVSSKGEQLVSRRSKQACAAAILDTLGNQTARAAVEQRTTV